MQQGSKTGKRALAIFLALIAAAGLGVAAFGPKWLAGSLDPAAGIGLMGTSRCEKGTCVYASNTEVVQYIEAEIARIVELNKQLEERQQLAVPRDPWDGWPVMGMIAFIASLAAAGGLVVGAVIAIAGKRVAWPIMPTTVVVLGLIVSLVTGCIFLATKPEGLELFGVGWTFGVFGGGMVLGLAAVFPLNRQIRPIDEELGASSATMSWGASRDDH